MEELLFGVESSRPASLLVCNGEETRPPSSSAASISTGSDSSSTSLIDFSSSRNDSPSYRFELGAIERGLSSAISCSRESLLDELLGEIRRSSTTSLASTPGSISEVEGESVFEYKLRRSEAELRTLGEWQELCVLPQGLGLVAGARSLHKLIQ